jgi:hypothetical protein
MITHAFPNFADDLWDKFEVIAKASTDHRKYYEELIAILEDAIACEDYYAKTMDKLALRTATISYKGTCDNAISTLKMAFINKANLTKSLTKSLREDVVDNLKEIVKIQNYEAKNLLNDGRKFEKDYKKVLETLEKQRNKYNQTSREADLANIENECIRYSKEVANDKKTKSAQKTQQTMKEAFENETQYKGKVAEYNTFLEKYYHGLKKINEQFQKHEEIRIESIKDDVFKTLLFDLNYVRNYQYDLERILKNLETVEVKKDIEEFIKENSDKRKDFYPKATFDQYTSFFQQSLYEPVPKNEREEPITEAFRKAYEVVVAHQEAELNEAAIDCPQATIEEKDNLKFISSLFNSSWKGDVVPQSDLKKFEELLKTKMYLKCWVYAFQQYRLSGKFILSDEGYNNIVKMLIVALNECYKIRDIYYTKRIVILSLTFSKIINVPNGNGGVKEEKIFLQTAVVQHAIWKDLDFWESAVFASIKEEMLSQKGYKLEATETDSDTLYRQKNLVFGQLASYGHNMLIFNLDKGEVKNLLTKFCKFYNLTEMQVKDIMSTLEQATKQNEHIQRLMKFVREAFRQKLKTQEDEQQKKIQGIDKDWETLKAEYTPQSPELNGTNSQDKPAKKIFDDKLKHEETKEGMNFNLNDVLPTRSSQITGISGSQGQTESHDPLSPTSIELTTKEPNRKISVDRKDVDDNTVSAERKISAEVKTFNDRKPSIDIEPEQIKIQSNEIPPVESNPQKPVDTEEPKTETEQTVDKLPEPSE